MTTIYNGFVVTVIYTVFSVPLQLIFGLGLAVLLFQNLKGKAFFRVVYFMPYVTPFVATSVVFSLLFSHSDNSPINRLLEALGLETQNWLSESDGVLTVLLGQDVPTLLRGPSLALLVIIYITCGFTRATAR
ncbi:MAG: sugar ABC transporter permease [Anaerolineae bacterium]|nr:sugar ABC transporter permease [Anaerolineae bacterium]